VLFQSYEKLKLIKLIKVSIKILSFPGAAILIIFIVPFIFFRALPAKEIPFFA